jgi:O-antigen ligase
VLGWGGLVAGSLFAGALAVTSLQLLGLVLLAAGLAVLFMRPVWAALGVLVVLPFPVSVVPGVGLQIGLSDLLVVVAVVGWGVQVLLNPPEGLRVRTVRPVSLGLVAYGAAAGLSLVVHPSQVGVITLVQRVIIVVGPLLVGALMVQSGRFRLALEGYLLSASILAVAAMASSGSEGFLGVQKNPAGGFLAAGLIIAVVVRPSRRWVLYAPVLAVGTLASQSRGALLGLIIGVGVTLLVVRFRERRRLVVAFGAAAAALVATFLSLSAGARSRLLDASSSTDFAVRYRDEFAADALDAFRAHPWIGVGVGSYTGGRRQPGIGDPHQVLYFQLAEGGVVLLVGFLVLVAVTFWVALRNAGRTPLAVAALAVQISTLVHALGDVYWVRGTPTMGFLLVGVSLAVVALDRQGDPRGLEWTTRRRGGDRQIAPRVPVAASAGAHRGG